MNPANGEIAKLNVAVDPALIVALVAEPLLAATEKSVAVPDKATVTFSPSEAPIVSVRLYCRVS